MSQCNVAPKGTMIAGSCIIAHQGGCGLMAASEDYIGGQNVFLLEMHCPNTKGIADFSIFEIGPD